MERCVELSATFPRRARLLLKSIDMLEAAAINLRIYHPDAIGSCSFQMQEEQEDGLGRAALHSWLDHNAPNPRLGDSEELLSSILHLRVATINDQDILGRTPLHIANQHRWVEAVKALLGLGANTVADTIDGSTPLHCAAVRGSVEICRDLLDYVIDSLTAVDCEGHMAGHYALKNAHTDVLNLLANYGSPRAGQLLRTSQDRNDAYGSLPRESAHNAGADHSPWHGDRLEDLALPTFIDPSTCFSLVQCYPELAKYTPKYPT
jgi:ankyrin repeat protein